MPRRHPALAHPVSATQFVAEFEELWARCGWLPGFRPRITFTPGGSRCNPPDLSRIHCTNARRYAEVDVERQHFYFAPQVLSLPRAHRRGLAAHEIGHVLVGTAPHREVDADAAAYEHLGISVGYDRRWPGKGLQVARDV